MRLQEIAERLGCKLTGDGEQEISGVAGIETARAGELTFLSNPRYRPLLKQTRASAVIAAQADDDIKASFLVSENPYLDFARALEMFYQPPRSAAGIHPTAVIDASASIGSEASIGAYTVIGREVVIGDRAVIHSHVTIYDGVRIGNDFLAHSHVAVREFCELGDRVILQNGVVIGPDGYGFAQPGDGSHYKIVQAGKVVIEDDVEVQAGSCIDRAAVGETRIGRGSKIDNLVQIGHAVRVGRNALLAAQVGIAGSTTIEADVVLAGQVGVNAHVTVGKGTRATGQTGITNTVPAGSFISGLPAIDNRAWRKAATSFRMLPALRKRVAALERRLAELEGKTEERPEETGDSRPETEDD